MKSKYPIMLHGVELTLRELDTQDVQEVVAEWKQERGYYLQEPDNSVDEFPLVVDTRREEQDLVRV